MAFTPAEANALTEAAREVRAFRSALTQVLQEEREGKSSSEDVAYRCRQTLRGAEGRLSHLVDQLGLGDIEDMLDLGPRPEDAVQTTCAPLKVVRDDDAVEVSPAAPERIRNLIDSARQLRERRAEVVKVLRELAAEYQRHIITLTDLESDQWDFESAVNAIGGLDGQMLDLGPNPIDITRKLGAIFTDEIFDDVADMDVINLPSSDTISVNRDN